MASDTIRHNLNSSARRVHESTGFLGWPLVYGQSGSEAYFMRIVQLDREIRLLRSGRNDDAHRIQPRRGRIDQTAESGELLPVELDLSLAYARIHPTQRL
jgi:hypothetical protein